MKLFLFSILFCAGQYCLSQITISSADFATGGDTVRMSYATDPTIDVLSTGPSFTWDFGNLVADSQQVHNFLSLGQAPGFIQFVYGPFAASAYQASYYLDATDLPLDQITSFLPVSIENIYQFTKRSTSSLSQVGYAMTVSGTDIPFKSDTIEKKYFLPLSYGDSNVSNGYTLIDFNPIIDAKWKQYRTRTSVTDGYGTITTPLGSFNVLRVKHKIVEKDSLYYTYPFIGATWLPIPVADTYEYEWLAANEKEPVLRIRSQMVLGNEVISSIQYRDVNRFLDASVAELTKQLEIFPNPASDFISLIGPNTTRSISIYNSSGQLIRTILPTTEKIFISDLTSGWYIVRLENHEGNYTFSKLIKE